jgi:hypothetical protein
MLEEPARRRGRGSGAGLLNARVNSDAVGPTARALHWLHGRAHCDSLNPPASTQSTTSVLYRSMLKR